MYNKYDMYNMWFIIHPMGVQHTCYSGLMTIAKPALVVSPKLTLRGPGSRSPPMIIVAFLSAVQGRNIAGFLYKSG